MNLQVASFLLWNRGQVTFCFVLHLSNASALWRPTFVWTTAEGVREKLALLGKRLHAMWSTASMNRDNGWLGHPSSMGIWSSQSGCPKGPGLRNLDELNYLWIGLNLNASHVSQWFVNLYKLKLMIVRYMAAGKIRTVRNLLVAPEFSKLHPTLDEILRWSLDGGWKLWAAWLKTSFSLHWLDSVMSTEIPSSSSWHPVLFSGWRRCVERPIGQIQDQVQLRGFGPNCRFEIQTVQDGFWLTHFFEMESHGTGEGLVPCLFLSLAGFLSRGCGNWNLAASHSKHLRCGCWHMGVKRQLLIASSSVTVFPWLRELQVKPGFLSFGFASHEFAFCKVRATICNLIRQWQRRMSMSKFKPVCPCHCLMT